jgi:hypothetical protein
MNAINSSGTAAVDRAYHWLDIDKDKPRGVKLQLIHRPSGVATYSIYRNCDHWTHWRELPTFSKEDQS